MKSLCLLLLLYLLLCYYLIDVWEQYLIRDWTTAIINPVSIQKRISKRRREPVSAHGSLMPPVLEAMAMFESETSEAPSDVLNNSITSKAGGMGNIGSPNTLLLTPLPAAKKVGKEKSVPRSANSRKPASGAKSGRKSATALKKLNV